jgi:hypothetical protein
LPANLLAFLSGKLLVGILIKRLECMASMQEWLEETCIARGLTDMSAKQVRVGQHSKILGDTKEPPQVEEPSVEPAPSLQEVDELSLVRNTSPRLVEEQAEAFPSPANSLSDSAPLEETKEPESGAAPNSGPPLDHPYYKEICQSYQLLNQLLAAPDWQNVGVQKEIEIAKKDIPNSQTPCIKGVGIMDAVAPAVVDLLKDLDVRKVWDEQVSFAKGIESFGRICYFFFGCC